MSLNSWKGVEAITPELGARAYVCLATENDEPGYIAGFGGYVSITEGDDEMIDLYHWWIEAWDKPMNLSLLDGVRQMVHDWQDLGASEETIVTWFNAWESRPLYDEAEEQSFIEYSWEEAVANGEHWAMTDYE